MLEKNKLSNVFYYFLSRSIIICIVEDVQRQIFKILHQQYERVYTKCRVVCDFFVDYKIETRERNIFCNYYSKF